MKFIEVRKKEDYVIVKINRPKVNALNFQLVSEIRDCFRESENDDTIRGVILTGLPNIFSAGLDLVELYHYDEEEIRNFMISFGSMHIELVKFKKPFICAINGHSPDGGTVIAIAADYRIMAEGEQFGIGLNEMSVNVQISSNLINAYSFWLGRSAAYKYIMEGKLFSPNEAKEVNLVDELAPEIEILDRAEKRMKKYLSADNSILLNTKAKLRAEWIDTLEDSAEKDLKETLEVWWKPEIRMKMEMFLTMLKSKKK